MKKAIILLAFVFALALTACGNEVNESIESVHNDITVSDETPVSVEPAGSNEAPVSDDVEAADDTQRVEDKIRIIASNIGMWTESAEYANDVYNYAVTDLDGNGRLEIIASNIGGTGVYTYSTFYEINEDLDGLAAWDYVTEEGDSQADIAVDSVDGFYDSQKGIMYYIFDDFLKSGAAEYYENKRAMYFENGQVKEKLLAYRTTIYTEPNAEALITCMDKDGNEISEEEYEAIADKAFAGLEKKKVYFGWCQFFEPDELTNMSENELTAMLKESFEKFRME